MPSLRPCLVLPLALLALCAGLYPALVTAASALLFPHQAQGSLLVQDGRVRGSALLGQTLAHPEQHPGYVWGRPSAATVDPASGLVLSSGSNLGPRQAALQADVAARVQALRASGVEGPLPVDLVTRSASGLDPHLSPASVAAQIPRVARVRGLSEADVAALVARHTEGRTGGLLGEPRVNVLALNLALDARALR